MRRLVSYVPLALLSLLVLYGATGTNQVFAEANESARTSPNSSLQSSMALGDVHSCVVMTTTSVRCWGKGQFGRIGDGAQWDRITPVQLSSISNVAALSASVSNTCLLTNGGGVKCWGRNNSGQVGDGTTTDRLVPTTISSLSSGITAVSTGGYQSCAVTNSGGVKCWGQNTYGQVGDGTTTNRVAPVETITPNSGIVAVSVGLSHACALTDGGGVKCWGRNNFGQLGIGSTTDQSLPTDLGALTSGAVAIAAGDGQTCALLNTGLVKCWGQNASGFLGDGGVGDRLSPVEVQGISNAVAIAVGAQHQCALLSSGALKCWGANSNGQLGDASSISRTSPVVVNGYSTGVAAVSIGGNHSCALLVSGGVTCWGTNSSGELGNTSTTASNIPVGVSGIGSGAGVASTTTTTAPSSGSGSTVSSTTVAKTAPSTKSTSTVIGQTSTNTTLVKTSEPTVSTAKPDNSGTNSTNDNSGSTIPDGVTTGSDTDSGDTGTARQTSVVFDPRKKREQSAESFAFLAAAAVTSIAAAGTTRRLRSRVPAGDIRAVKMLAHLPEHTLVLTREKGSTAKKGQLEDNFEMSDSIENRDGGEISTPTDDVGNLFKATIFVIRQLSRMRFLRPGLRRWAELALLSPIAAALLPAISIVSGFIAGSKISQGNVSTLVAVVVLFCVSVWTPVLSILVSIGWSLGMVLDKRAFDQWTSSSILLVSGLMLIPLLERALVGPRGSEKVRCGRVATFVLAPCASGVVAWSWVHELCNSLVGNGNIQVLDQLFFLGFSVATTLIVFELALLARLKAGPRGEPLPLFDERMKYQGGQLRSRHEYVESVPIKLGKPSQLLHWVRGVVAVVVISYGLRDTVSMNPLAYSVPFVCTYYVIQEFHEKASIRPFHPSPRSFLLVAFAAVVGIGEYENVDFLMFLVMAVTISVLFIRTLRLWPDSLEEESPQAL